MFSSLSYIISQTQYTLGYLLHNTIDYHGKYMKVRRKCIVFFVFYQGYHPVRLPDLYKPSVLNPSVMI